jgi:hypothetical protein
MAGTSIDGGQEFSDQSQLVDAQVELTRGRIRFALAHRERKATGEDGLLQEWPEEFFQAEEIVAARMQATLDAGIQLPLAWLERRLGLGVPELRLIWVLLTHEMCAVARGLLRQLNTENCADPTTDTICLVAFGPGNHADASRLLAPSSALVRGGLIERTDPEPNAADHRKTWKVARRILALAHHDLSLDPELFRLASVVQPDDTTLGIAGEGIEADPKPCPR